MTLTDEEKRHIEQRRDNEKRFNLGYNQALADLETFRESVEDSDLPSNLNVFISKMRKHIR